GGRLGVGHHRSELERAEHPPAAADTILPVQDGSAILELDRERYQSPQRGRHNETGAGQQTVEPAFDHATPAPAATRANRSWYACTATLRSNCNATCRPRAPIS